MPRCQRLSFIPGAAACCTFLLLLFTLALVQHSRFAAADACQCGSGSGFKSQITGCLGTSDGPCPPPVDKVKEPLFNATLEWDLKVDTMYVPAGVADIDMILCFDYTYAFIAIGCAAASRVCCRGYL